MKVYITKKILELSNICISTVAFTFIVVVLLLYSLDIIDLAKTTIYIYYSLIIFVMDQLLIKPLFEFIEKNYNNIKELFTTTIPRIFK